jgi:hypothetical protein
LVRVSSIENGFIIDNTNIQKKLGITKLFFNYILFFN